MMRIPACAGVGWMLALLITLMATAIAQEDGPSVTADSPSSPGAAAEAGVEAPLGNASPPGETTDTPSAEAAEEAETTAPAQEATEIAPATELEAEPIEVIDPGKPASCKSFNHAVHIEADLGCVDCHSDARESEHPARPGGEICANCHDTPKEGPNPYCIKPTPSTPGLRVLFSHKGHLDRSPKPDCDTCHSEVKEAGEIVPALVPDQKTCERCHEARMWRLNKCALCHKETPEPGNHGTGWINRHGFFGKGRIARDHGQACKSCHRTNSCRACHQTTKPRNHTTFFKMRGHGMISAGNRNSCRTCHRPHFCTRCHRRTRPANHRNLYNWKRYLHGKVAPGSKNSTMGGCRLCHRDSQCRRCHNK